MSLTWLAEKQTHFSDAMSGQSTDLLKYGIGIVNKTAAIGFDGLSFGHAVMAVSGAEMYSLEEAATHADLEKWLKKYSFHSADRIERNPYFGKTAAAFVDSAVVHVEKSGDVHLNIQTKDPNGLCYVMVVVNPGVDVTIRESLSVHNYLGLIVDVVLLDRATVNYIAVQETNETAYTSVMRNAVVRHDAEMNWFDMHFGGKMTMSSIVTYLSKPGAIGNTRSVAFGSDNQVFDLYNATEHMASQTISDMKTKVVLDDAAKTIYRGLVKVHNGAVCCEGYQQEDTLLLSPKAEIDSVPDLEIANNDVKCSHGVTTTRLNKEKLFYLQSRGLSEDDAATLAIQAHVGDIIGLIPDEALREVLLEKVGKR